MPKIMLNDREYSGGSSANIDITTSLTQDTVSDTSVPSSKAVYSIVDNLQTELNNVIDDNNKINEDLLNCGTFVEELATSTVASTWESVAVDLSKYRFLYFEVFGATGFGFEPRLIPVNIAILHNSTQSAYNFKYNDKIYGFYATPNSIAVYSQDLTYASRIIGVY